MISIYNFKDYREFILARFAQMSKRGYGQSVRLARHLGVHTTLVSQVLGGPKAFTLEQGAMTADFLGLSDPEAEYFLLLIQFDRAGNAALKRVLQRQMEKLRLSQMELSNRLSSEATLSDEKRAVFYSDWVYSAVRQSVAIKGCGSVDEISQFLNLSRKRTRDVIDFLLRSNLIVEDKAGFRPGVKSTHLESSSPWVRVHHMNWREKAIENLQSEDPSKLHYTCPMTLSRADAVKVREMIVKFLETVDRVIDPSPSEELRCLNIDWFKI